AESRELARPLPSETRVTIEWVSWHRRCSPGTHSAGGHGLMKPTIGIDAIALAVPEGYLDLADLAAARGVPAGKYVDGLGVSRMSVARQHEDPVALAATAARRLFATSGVDASTIGLCVVGT